MIVNTAARERITGEASLTAFVRQSALEAGRLLRRWRRDPIVTVQALLFPTFLLIIYKLLIGKAVLALTGSDSLYGLVPMCAVVGAIFGTLGAGLALPAERESGLLTRLWVLPIHRASALSGRLLAEAVRTAGSAVVLTAFGVALGLRFADGWAAAVEFVLVPVMISVGVATVVIAIAVRADGRAMVTWLGAGCVVLLFFNTGVAPAEVFPSWLQPAVRLLIAHGSSAIMRQETRCRRAEPCVCSRPSRGYMAHHSSRCWIAVPRSASSPSRPPPYNSRSPGG